VLSPTRGLYDVFFGFSNSFRGLEASFRCISAINSKSLATAWRTMSTTHPRSPIVSLIVSEESLMKPATMVANAQTVAKGFEIILKNPKVKAIFVNIFGGIVRCDRIANGILEATKKVEVNVPVVVRLDGTNAAEAAEILKNANIKNIIPATDLLDGAKKAVAAAKGELK
jgi:hypothetical protein